MIQIISLESLNLFESFFKLLKFEYSKQFTTEITKEREIILLIRYCEHFEIPDNSRIIFYSNFRDSRFVQIKFELDDNIKRF